MGENENERLISEFILSRGALSQKRQDKYRYILKKAEKHFSKDFRQVTKEELIHYVSEIQGNGYRDWTKWDHKACMKRFFGWLKGPEFVSFIHLGKVKAAVGPEDILTKEELDRLRFACNNLRDKALIETAYESAARPSELLSLNKNDVGFDDLGAVLYVRHGKTGPRRIRLVRAAPLLAEWIAHHPVRDDDAPLWVDLSQNTKYHRLEHVGLIRAFRRIAARANMNKKVKPYTFRHTRLTDLAAFMTEAQLRVFAGWAQGSDMSSTYVHIQDTDDVILRSYGLKENETVKEQLPKKCVRCGQANQPEAERCFRCGMALSLKAAVRLEDDVMPRLQRIERVLERFLRNTSSSEP